MAHGARALVSRPERVIALYPTPAMQHSGSSTCRVKTSLRFSTHAKGVANGIYFYRLIAGEYTQTRKMVLMR
jgi:hypothetical protein